MNKKLQFILFVIVCVAITAVGTFALVKINGSRDEPLAVTVVPPSSNAGSESEREIVITAIYPPKVLLNNVLWYKIYYKGVGVRFDTLYNTRLEGLNNSEAAAKWLHMKIMANDVGDIVVVRDETLGIDLYNAFKIDAFMDLSALIKGDDSYGELNKSILEAITLDNRIMGLPIGSSIPETVYNKGLGDRLGLDIDINRGIKWSDLLEIAKKLEAENSEVYLLSPYCKFDNILEKLLIANMPDLVDIENKTYDLKQEWFAELMRSFKEVSKSPNFINPECRGTYDSLKPQNFDLAPLGLARELAGDPTSDKALFLIDHPADCLFYELIRWSDSRFSNARWFDRRELSYLPATVGELSKNLTVSQSLVCSISSKARNKNDAWDFLSVTIMERPQSFYNLRSVPINMRGWESVYTDFESGWSIRETSYGTDEDYAEHKRQIENRYGHVDSFFPMAEYISDILGPLEDFMNDRLTLDEALSKAEDGVWLRLHE